MKWIKASDRLPGIEMWYNCKYQDKPIALFINKRKKTICREDGLEMDWSLWDQIVYLDESETTIDEAMEKAKPFLNIWDFQQDAYYFDVDDFKQFLTSILKP